MLIQMAGDGTGHLRDEDAFFRYYTKAESLEADTTKADR